MDIQKKDNGLLKILKLKQSEEELYARHKEMKDQLERTRAELEDKSEFGRKQSEF